MQADSFLLGAVHPDHGLRHLPVGISDDRHLFVMAGSRSGKGTSMIIPNLIHWQGGLVCVDPKGENASITAIRRGAAKVAREAKGSSVKKTLGQDVAILDPMGVVEGPAKTYRFSYDPLSDIDIGSKDEVRQIEAITEAIVMSDGDNNSHWTDSARIILKGIIEAVLHSEPPENHTLAFCRKVYQHGMAELPNYLTKFGMTEGGLAIDAAALIDDAGDEEAGSFSTTLSRQLTFLSDPRMQSHLVNEGFSLAEAVRKNASVYLCVPPSQIDRLKRWLRTLIRVALDAKMFGPKHVGQQTLFLLDEFPALGKMAEIEGSAAYMAGYGIKLVPVIQNIGQVKQIYNKNWETFLGNAGGIIAWGLNDLESEKYIADRLGNLLTVETSVSTGENRQGLAWRPTSRTVGTSTALHERPVRRPNEIHEEGARETKRAFIVPAKGDSFTVLRQDYFDRSVYSRDLYNSPDEIAAWETRFATQG